MTNTVFLLLPHASEFVTRDIGKFLRSKLLDFETLAPPDEQVIIDASGVTIMTPSFVDEFFGRTAAAIGLERFRCRFKIIGVEGETKQLINKVVRNRLILQRRESAGSVTCAMPHSNAGDSLR